MRFFVLCAILNLVLGLRIAEHPLTAPSILGGIYEEEGDAARAAQAYRAALAANPHNRIAAEALSALAGGKIGWIGAYPPSP